MDGAIEMRDRETLNRASTSGDRQAVAGETRQRPIELNQDFRIVALA
jgi:hypothetical protein